MLLYRVAPYLASATDKSQPGHPEYLHRPQGQGRVDNPGIYDVWYLSVTEAGAIGETFASHPVWDDDIFNFRDLPSARFALHTFSIPNNCRIIDLDDARALLELGLRPTQVITTNKSVTQGWAMTLYQSNSATGPAWDGVRWWSRHHPDWPVMGLWRTVPQYQETSALTVSHTAVKDAAQTLIRNIR
jgi:hypothetical protein